MGLKGEVSGCKKTPADVKAKLREAFDKKAESDAATFQDVDEDAMEMQELFDTALGKKPASSVIRSIDGSGYTKTARKLFELLDAFVEEIGETNVVQVITDNGSNYVLAGKHLEAKRKNLFWTPCAAHSAHFLNPSHFYKDPAIDENYEVSEGLYKVIERLSSSVHDNDLTIQQVGIYKNAEKGFNGPTAKRQIDTMAPSKLHCFFLNSINCLCKD
ncbi:hypothetical protein RIF29_19282 [Crotalaria pallida]|uniref:DUF659 domain-containing protein n=1 Tax=Crotalaria pallida TaxID=3830 RepID=A0AAN9I404_CROPI